MIPQDVHLRDKDNVVFKDMYLRDDSGVGNHTLPDNTVTDLPMCWGIDDTIVQGCS